MVRENSVRLQNQQDTMELRNIVTWVNSGSDHAEGILEFLLGTAYGIIADDNRKGPNQSIEIISASLERKM